MPPAISYDDKQDPQEIYTDKNNYVIEPTRSENALPFAIAGATAFAATVLRKKTLSFSNSSTTVTITSKRSTNETSPPPVEEEEEEEEPKPEPEPEPEPEQNDKDGSEPNLFLSLLAISVPAVAAYTGIKLIRLFTRKPKV